MWSRLDAENSVKNRLMLDVVRVAQPTEDQSVEPSRTRPGLPRTRAAARRRPDTATFVASIARRAVCNPSRRSHSRPLVRRTPCLGGILPRVSPWIASQAENLSSQPSSLVGGHTPTGAHVGEHRQARRLHDGPPACDS